MKILSNKALRSWSYFGSYSRLKQEVSNLHEVRELLGAEVVDSKISALEYQLRPLLEICGESYIAGRVTTKGVISLVATKLQPNREE